MFSVCCCATLGRPSLILPSYRHSGFPTVMIYDQISDGTYRLVLAETEALTGDDIRLKRKLITTCLRTEIWKLRRDRPI